MGSARDASVRRLQPHKPLPPYSYVTGKFPHPIRDDAGHSFGVEISVATFDAQQWQRCEAYLFGIDLFNLGFYWEAHEQWEAVWHAAGRRGRIADFLKGLIKLAAAGVKAREGRVDGVRRHARRAEQLFVAAACGDQQVLGLDVDVLLEFTKWTQQNAAELIDTSDANVLRVWQFVLAVE